jgi:lysophospholipase L1-like esterase
MSKIVIFGDSLVQGALDLEKGGWSNRLKMFLWQKNTQITGLYFEGPNVFNFGIGGDTTTDIYKRFNCEINTVRGDISTIIFAVGINDAGFRGGKKTNSKKNFEKEFRLLVDEGVKRVGVENVYVIGLINVCDKALEEWFNEDRLVEFDGIIKNIADDVGCNLISMYGILEKSDFCEDSLHPNAQGHEKIFERIKNSLIECGVI